MEFKDLFSSRAALYSQYRPSYPPELFDWLAGLVRDHQLAWDCATGNGQAALGLADKFARVVATDASRDQIAHAQPHPKVEYRVGRADASGLNSSSANLVTVAQAMHWLDLETFYDEVRRVLAPGGAIAVWGYGDPILDTPELDRIVHEYNRGTIENYWMPERELLLAGYSTIPFPFREIEAPTLTLNCEWTLAELAGYLRTWSATAAYAAQRGIDPVVQVERALAATWGGPERRRLIRWPLYVRAGYNK